MPAPERKAQTPTSLEMLPSQPNFGRLVLRALAAAEQRIEIGAAREAAEGGAVLGRHRVEEVRGFQAAGARHVLHDDIGLAGNVASDVARERAGVEVIAAARRIAEYEVDVPAGVELGGALSMRRGADTQRQRPQNCSRSNRFHGLSLARPIAETGTGFGIVC